MIDTFSNLSHYYDEFVGADYESICAYIHNMIHRYKSDASIVADLGCGSGTLTFLLSALGYDMIGIDSSPAMLAEAYNKKPIDSDVLFLQQDLTELDLYGTVDAMISTLDCVNYLTSETALKKYISKCALFSNPDALLIFDFNTLYKYQNILYKHNFVYETDDSFCVWENEFDGRKMNYNLTFFVQNGKEYKRHQDHQTQTYFPPEMIYYLLEKYNYKILNTTDDYTDRSVGAETQRIVVVAQKEN